ncbi:hypothetical protein ONZ43_g5214 [Nemania bipapillata]|uniref:Uncharacterized protein n=1 Tax=Nemania bipapillata TaxID=110536 RepID=A0ACC2ID85_9PEZI|nr:hypothetical protein ONZ43_g5214 [Nemania bipapillata]
MFALQNQTKKPLARDIAALGDVELDRYLQEDCRDGDIIVVDVEDPENLPESLIQRLRDRTRDPAFTVRSRPVDLDQVTARLLELPADYNEKLRPYIHKPGYETASPTHPPTPTEVVERRAYAKLVADGGRPLFPIHRFDDVVRDPGAHQDMLRPWLDWPDAEDPRFDVYSGQWFSWDCFRKWQMYNRGCGTPLYIGKVEFDTFFNHFHRRSPTYTEAARKLLARYEFTRPVQFLDDPKQQDKLTTWIEYIAFACSLHYHEAGLAEHFRPKFDEAWKTLVGSGVLRPEETLEYICNPESAIARDAERVGLWAELTLAKEAVASAQKAISDRAQGSSCGAKVASTCARTAQSRLDEINQSLAIFQNRSDLFSAFHYAARPYNLAARDAEKRNTQLQWIFEQLPLVEAEMVVSGTAPNQIRGTKRGKNKEYADTAKRNIKKRKTNTLHTHSTNNNIPGHDDRNYDQKELARHGARNGQGSDNTKYAKDSDGTSNRGNYDSAPSKRSTFSASEAS